MTKQKLSLYIVDPDRSVAADAEQASAAVGVTSFHYPVPARALEEIESAARKDEAFILMVRAKMPVMAGNMFLRALKTGPAAGNVKYIIFLAAPDDFEEIRTAIGSGIDMLLPHAPSVAQLRDAIKESVETAIIDQVRHDTFDQQSVGDTQGTGGDNITYLSANSGDSQTIEEIGEGADSLLQGLRVIERPLKKILRPDLTAQQDRLALIKVTQFIRRVRDRLVPACADGDPSWEIFLYVMEQAELGNRVSVTAACHASAIPQTTAMRKIDELVAMGLLGRAPDPSDRRRINLSPTDLGESQLHAYLQDALAYMQAMFGLPGGDNEKSGGAQPYSHAAE